MPRPPKAKQPIKDAALRLFVEQGIDATGIREIAQEAGYSEAALYRHWTNKEDLVQHLFAEHLQEVVGRLDSQLQIDGNCFAKLEAATQALYVLYDEQPYAFRFVLLIQHDLGPALDGSVRMPHECIEDLISSYFPKAERAEVILCAGALVGVFIEASSRVIYDHLPLPLAQYAGTVAKHCHALLEGMSKDHEPAPGFH